MPGVDKLVDELYPLKYITGINQHFRIINKSFRIAGNKNDFFRTPTLRQCGNCTALLMGSRARRIYNNNLHTIQIFRLKRRLEQIAADYPYIVDLITVQSILQPFQGSRGRIGRNYFFSPVLCQRIGKGSQPAKQVGGFSSGVPCVACARSYHGIFRRFGGW